MTALVRKRNLLLLRKIVPVLSITEDVCLHDGANAGAPGAAGNV